MAKSLACFDTAGYNLALPSLLSSSPAMDEATVMFSLSISVCLPSLWQLCAILLLNIGSLDWDASSEERRECVWEKLHKWNMTWEERGVCVGFQEENLSSEMHPWDPGRRRLGRGVSLSVSPCISLGIAPDNSKLQDGQVFKVEFNDHRLKSIIRGNPPGDGGVVIWALSLVRTQAACTYKSGVLDSDMFIQVVTSVLVWSCLNSQFSRMPVPLPAFCYCNKILKIFSKIKYLGLSVWWSGSVVKWCLVGDVQPSRALYPRPGCSRKAKEEAKTPRFPSPAHTQCPAPPHTHSSIHLVKVLLIPS